jgi:hypothetical protein
MNTTTRKCTATPVAVLVLLVGLLAALLVTAPALAGGSQVQAATLTWPGQWVNPLTNTSRYNDWGFNTCNPDYAYGQRAHLGADSQGGSGPVRAMHSGVVKSIVGYSTGQGVVVEHQAQSGPFVAVYGHINPSVGVGAGVSPGQQIGTVTNWGGNTHLHLSIIPGAYRPGMHLWGTRECGATNPGYANPLPWLAGQQPKGSTPPGYISASWSRHGGVAKRIAVTRGSKAADPWFAVHIGSDNALYWKRTTDGGWTRMNGTWAREVSAMTNDDGRVEIFHVGSNGAMYHSWQSRADGPFGPWVNRGGDWRALAVTRGTYGGWQAFAVGQDRNLYRMAPWDGVGNWTRMSGVNLARVAAMTNPDGRIELLTVNTGGEMWHTWQPSPRSGWASWVNVPGFARDIAMVPKAGGGWNMYHVGRERNLFVRSIGTNTWRQFNAVADLVAVSQNRDGREEVFHINTDNGSMWHAWQIAAGRWG